jgi:hypothetical protein
MDDSRVSVAVEGWARAICQAPTARPDAIAGALGVDPAHARRLGQVLAFPPPVGAARFELVVDPATGAVECADAALAPPGVPLAELREVFGEPRRVPRGPHEHGITMIFDPVRPAGAPRTGTLLARVQSGSEPPLVTSVVVYLHPVPPG